ncbi:MAG: hypothetical protein KGH75_03550 [Rhodospirillales bacterium]|nr:hypothetical protein [Rhodospirillales bacterium]
MRLSLAIMGVCAVALSTQAHAQTQRHKLAGYECMMLNITEQQSMDPHFHVNLKAQPSASSATVGWQPAIVIVKEPAVPENGFLQVIRANGQKAWIEESIVKPYRAAADPTAKCAPEVMPSGMIGPGPG